MDAPIYFNPIPVSTPAFARATTHLYVISGAAASNPGLRIPQFLALDLNVPWNTSSPAWSKHADGGPMQDLFPAAFSADEKILYAFHLDKSSSPMQWDSDTEVWKSLTNVKFENATWQGIGAVTDPRTGLIYLAGGYNDDSNLGGDPLFLAMDVFDPVSQSLDMVSEFKVDTQDWSVMVTTGPTPSMRADHCMVANEDGTKVVIYGGRLHNGTVVGDVSILDTTTQTWTTGVSGQPRMYVACTVAGDQLLIWGGKAADNLAPPLDLIIYNFVTKTWTTQYTPPASYKNLKAPAPLKYMETPSEYRPAPNNPEYVAPMFSALRAFVEFDEGPGASGSGSRNGGIGGGIAGSNRWNARRTVQDATGMGISSNMGSWVRAPLDPHANITGYSGRVRRSSRAMSM
ncbi:hypothetical protein BGZ95_012030 [Linnemannia exigua]|uniref:Galactose oxidase n=1 Tax=Linnemannia exigua TaxID=604196 RepID=A0AAD4DJU5_9FUNG|nr:hypothetical protein BGZ95_012030 [Linnemannia exigua]